jgi:hypothetical protein
VADARAYLAKRKVEPEVARAARLRVGDSVTFPWFDPSGAEVYWTRRSLNGTKPKYLHRPGTRPALYAGPGAWEAVSHCPPYREERGWDRDRLSLFRARLLCSRPFRARKKSPTRPCSSGSR